jgi:hypothetical protein
VATHRSAASPPLRRTGRRLAIAAAVVSPLLAGCGAGFQAQTNQIYQPGPGITDRSDGVYVVNALVVTDGEGHGTLVGGLINQEPRPDKLESASVACRTGAAPKASIAGGTVALPSQRTVQLADTGVVRLTGTLRAGSFCTLSVTFQRAAPVDMDIPIVANSADYAAVPLGPTPPGTTPS